MADLTLEDYRDFSGKKMCQFLKLEALKMFRVGPLEPRYQKSFRSSAAFSPAKARMKKFYLKHFFEGTWSKMQGIFIQLVRAFQGA